MRTAARSGGGPVIIYSIYPRSFQDSSRAAGDIAGIIQRCPTFRTRVDAIWLSPIFPSPMVDSARTSYRSPHRSAVQARWSSSTRW